MRRMGFGDLVVIAVLVALMGGLLAPVIAQARRTQAEARCQSNLKRLAEAVALYTADHQGRYPTNRRIGASVIANTVDLSPLTVDCAGNLIITPFVYGVNWVEGIQGYVIDAARTTGQDWQSFFRCPNASTATYPPNSPTARVTYAFNYNLIEQPVGIAHNPDKLMMMRELDRAMGSTCRPTSLCSWQSTGSPNSPFLNTQDALLPTHIIDPNRHAGDGSHIMFADGHVRHFTAGYFPPKTLYTVTNSFDYETQQWYNFGPKAKNVPASMIKSIAITP